MEFVILSTLATVAILLAELRDLAGREPVGRATPTRGTSRDAGVVASGTAANDQTAGPPRELGRAA